MLKISTPEDMFPRQRQHGLIKKLVSIGLSV